MVATTTDLRPLRKRVWELRIIDTFRGQFHHGMPLGGSHTTFRLSKQAALAGHVSFSPRPHALGDLSVTITQEPGDVLNIEQLGWWMAPATKDGEMVGPIDP